MIARTSVPRHNAPPRSSSSVFIDNGLTEGKELQEVDEMHTAESSANTLYGRVLFKIDIESHPCPACDCWLDVCMYNGNNVHGLIGVGARCPSLAFIGAQVRPEPDANRA